MEERGCDALVIHCMDYRLQKVLNDWLEQHLGPRGYDRVAIAGGVFDVYALLKHVAIAKQLHKVKKIVLINHEDCGAYGDAGTYERHKQDLAEAEHKIHALFPGLVIERHYLRLNGIFERLL